jgi:hypothetical protein
VEAEGNLALRALGFALQENPSYPLGGWLLTTHDFARLASEHF